MQVFNHTKYLYKQNNTPRYHIELGSASDQSAKLHPTFGLSGKSILDLPSAKTLKQVQGDNYIVGNTAHPPRCHAELGSASDQSAKPHPTFGLSNKSMQAIPMGKTLKHLTASPTDTGSHNSLRCVGSLCKVQGDSSLCAYTQRDSLYFHPNINYRISFGALKKNQFDGIDLAVVEKFKAPIEKFNSNNDLQNWAKEQAETIAKTDFGGRQKETQIQRKAMLKEWSDYVFNENDAYNNTTALLILNAITKDLQPNNDKLPPVLNKGVLADCISEIDKNTKADSKYQFDLNKIYETKLRVIYLQDTKTENGNTGWVIIPSKTNDPENFEQNVEKLKTLSHKNWCTKSFNAEPYLSQGDFHVYLENGQPKLGVRFVGNKIQEIQGELNNSRIPLKYFDEVKRYIDENGLCLSNNVSKEIQLAQKSKREIEKAKRDLRESIKNKDVKAIFEYFAIPVKEDENGFLTISEYKQPSEEFSFSDIGIDENMFFEKVKKIEGDSIFSYSKVTNLKNLESIGGFANFQNSQITALGNLKSIREDADFENSQVKNLGKLTSIGGSAYFINSKVINLGNLTSIREDADFENSKVKNLGKLTSIGRNANFQNSQVKNLGKLTSIGGDADFQNSQMTDLGNLTSIGWDAHFNNSKVINLENLTSIGGNAYFWYSQVTNLGKLESIGKNAYFDGSQVTNLGNLKSIGQNVDFEFTKIKDLGNLESIGGNAFFTNSQITDLGNLKSIGRSAYFDESQVTKLGKLETIGQEAIWGPQVEDFGNLKTVNGKPFVPFK